MTKREQFLSAKWEISFKDGLPFNPLADKDCTKCRGHGITDDGGYAFTPNNCNECWSKSND